MSWEYKRVYIKKIHPHFLAVLGFLSVFSVELTSLAILGENIVILLNKDMLKVMLFVYYHFQTFILKSLSCVCPMVYLYCMKFCV